MMTDHTSDGYLEVISLIARLHRQVLEVIKLELDRLGMHDINNVQALMLFNIGEAEISIGELISRGYYLGSNVSYNVKKMIENGYLSHERSVHDRRSIRVRLARKGRTLRDQLDGMYQRHLQRLGHNRITDADLQLVAAILRELERFWLGLSDPYRQT